MPSRQGLGAADWHQRSLASRAARVSRPPWRPFCLFKDKRYTSPSQGGSLHSHSRAQGSEHLQSVLEVSERKSLTLLRGVALAAGSRPSLSCRENCFARDFPQLWSEGGSLPAFLSHLGFGGRWFYSVALSFDLKASHLGAGARGGKDGPSAVSGAAGGCWWNVTENGPG